MEGECLNVKRRKNAVSPAVCLAGLAVLFLIFIAVKGRLQAAETSFGDTVKQNMAQEFAQSLTDKFLPVFAYVQQGESGAGSMTERQLAEMMALYGYYRESQSGIASEEGREAYLSLEDILLAEAQETNAELAEGSEADGGTEMQEISEDVQTGTEDSLQELLKAENEAALLNMEQSHSFVPHGLQTKVDLQALGNYETLVKNFYTIDKNTMAGSDQLNVAKLLEKDLTISKEGEEPRILIYHTHSQEAFSDSVPGDEGTSIVGVGAHLSEILSAEYGYKVLHHKGQYDVESRNDAYSYSLPEIEKILAENPSIEVIIDLHRDSMPDETKLVMDLDGRPTARFMFFNGLSRTRKTGNIAYLYNENQADNLAFSFQMQLKATEYYPGLTRKIYLKGYRYNMHLRPRTTLIELGAQNNTVEEAMNACDPLAHILDMVLSGTAE